MTDRHVLPLTRIDRSKAIAGLDIAIAKGGWLMELRAATRTDDQNRAIHSLVSQILKQRPFHCGLKMSMETYKAIFMHALGRELKMLPTLDGDSMFPMGLSTSKLTVGEGSALIEFILAWAAREGLTIEHFDGDQGSSGANNSAGEIAA